MSNSQLFTGPDAGAYGRLAWVREPQLLSAIRDQAAPALADRDAVLVDLGTGSGAVLSMLSPLASSTIGIDKSPDMVDQARQVAPRPSGRQLNVLEGDAHGLPLDDKSADLVVMRNVLHYLHTPATAFSEVRRVLKSKGAFLIAESVSPTARTLAWWREILLAKNPDRNPDLVFTAAGLSAFIECHGLRIVNRQTVATQLSVADWLERPTVGLELRKQLLDRFRSAPPPVRTDHRIEVGLPPLGAGVSALRTSAVITAQWRS